MELVTGVIRAMSYGYQGISFGISYQIVSEYGSDMIDFAIGFISEYGVFAFLFLVVILTWSYLSRESSARETLRENVDAERDKAFTKLTEQIQVSNKEFYAEILSLRDHATRQDETIKSLRASLIQQNTVIVSLKRQVKKLSDALTLERQNNKAFRIKAREMRDKYKARDEKQRKVLHRYKQLLTECQEKQKGL